MPSDQRPERMKVVILAGGLGTRLAEETELRPKPMVEIGGRPILWHIMKMYTAHGLTDFIICLGYKGYVIKEYFSNYFLHMSDVTFDMRSNAMQVHNAKAEPWSVTLVDTGDTTMIGGRIKRILPFIGDDRAFCLTYGDGVGDVDVSAGIALHFAEGRLATVTATMPPGRFGALETRRAIASPASRRSRWAMVAGSMEDSSYCPHGRRVYRERRDGVGTRADGAPGPREPALGLFPPRLLAADGHAARSPSARGALGREQGALENLVGAWCGGSELRHAVGRAPLRTSEP